MPVTVFIRYQIDPFKRNKFEAYARRWLDIIPNHGGELHVSRSMKDIVRACEPTTRGGRTSSLPNSSN